MCQAGTVWAAATPFLVSATVPNATGISMVVDYSPVPPAAVNFTQQAAGNTALSFDAYGGMVYNSTYSTWNPSVFYAINITATGGSGAPDTYISYTEGTNPNNGSAAQKSLGYKVTATFVAEPGETTLTTPPKQMLINLATQQHVAYTQLPANGYLRIYVGVCTGTDSTGCQQFTNADAGGSTFTGTLNITATVN